MFFGLLAVVLLFGGETRYIIETGFSSLGRMVQNFIDLSTFTDPLRTSNFPQTWTIYYWHTDGYGAWQRRSLSVAFRVEEQFDRQYWVAMYSALARL